ncbi:Histone-lysine N-methyltransferase, H3 lysine-9 specific SUVH5 [Dichanthelium oligosanthes]|uniref:Histone-lysine N-methyltransferase, H3 lysine-9 specific SUVH5 n=1 Tax=Dichanthelium oligosanthes TaxID=888268 RepID=A0A1E5V4A6_9POAL|nr:Histone-lysine N-methyltransferase, H3 lysine-9 specific SUVH5 [Dichanthelium oligosanthes]
MDFYAARLDAARHRRLPEPAGRFGRAWPPPQRADRRGLSPPPPRRHPLPPPRRPPTPHPRGGRGGDTRRGGGLAEREVAALGAAAAWRGNAATVAGELVGDAPAAGAAASVVAREEERGGGGEVGTKRCLPLAPPYPPPKRRSGAEAGLRFGDAAAPPAGGMDGALFGAVSPSAAGTSEVSAAGADGPVADSGRHGPEADVVKSSSEALRRSGVAAADGWLGIGSQGVPAVLVDGRGNGAGGSELERKELVPAASLQAELMMSFTKRSFPPGCGKDAVLSLLVGEGIGQEQLPLESGLADGHLGVAEQAVSTYGCISKVRGHDMEIVPSQRNATVDGTVQDDGLEAGEIPPEVVVQEYQVSASDTASRHGASAEIGDDETSAMQSSNEKTGGITLKCGEKRSSCLDAKGVEVMNESIGSSCNGVTESLAEDSSKQNLMCNRVSESARLNRASSDVGAVVSGNGSTVRSVLLHDSTAGRHEASVPEFGALETSVLQPSNEKTGGNTLQCGEKRSSGLVAKDVEVMNRSIGSPSNIVAESLAEDFSKQDMMGKRVFESARMNRASSDVAAGVSGDGTKMRHWAMFTPRESVKPIKVIKRSALDTQHRSFAEEETEHGRRVIINRIKDTNELTIGRVMQAPVSSDKGPTTQEKEAATTRGFFGPRKRVKVKAPAHLRMKIASTSALGSKGKLNDEVASNLDDDDILKALVVHEGKLELYLNNSSGLPSVRCQRQYGSQNADARSEFKMLCRRFEFVCRALVQAVEQHSLKIRRIDLEADKVIRKLPGFAKHGPIVGQVPGVEVGDEFLYRVQLAIVGLHRVYQGGIDTTTYRNGERIAISIVASGGYPDEFPSSGELIYTGSGGKPAGKKDDEDQKLERGNLALKNCIKTKTPVRVIHGFKGQNTEGGSHSRAKQISTFTYDGLYRVVDFWMHGRPGSRVFKYKLQKIPGQPELPMHIAKGMRKSKTRPGLCMVDISQGKEGTPICVINTVDDVRPTPFRYITRIKYPFGLTKICHQGCDCTNGCSDSASCACAVKNGGEIPFNLNGAIVNEKPLIFECGPSCKCPPLCQNRVSQHGMKIPLEVFRTTKRGWGVRSLRSISSGSFICEYVGELLYGKEADKRRNSGYLFDIGLNCGDENLCNGLLSTVSGLNSSSSCSQTMEDVGFTIDAAEYGNIGRFINHSCSPNLYTQNVLWDHDDKRMPRIMFFAAETIPPLQELTYDYNYEIDHVQDENGRIKFKVCQCGSPKCSGRLY